MHKAFLLATKTDLCKVMSHLDVLALLLAAAGHDAGHLGRSNAFEIASESPLALLYNNASPLENLHAATLLRIATRHGLFASCAATPSCLHLPPSALPPLSPPFPPSLDPCTPAPPFRIPATALAPGSLSRKERASCRQLIINLVVSTDMAHHNALHDSLRALPPPSATEAADALAARRTCLLKCALHAADLHVPTLPWASSVGWVRALGNEFKSMVEQETALQLPRSAFLLAADLTEQARIETGFVSRFVAPFFASMRKQLPQLACCEEMISSNLELWAEVADGTQAGPLDAAATPDEGGADCHAALARQQECVRRWHQLPTLLKPDELALAPN